MLTQLDLLIEIQALSATSYMRLYSSTFISHRFLQVWRKLSISLSLPGPIGRVWPRDGYLHKWMLSWRCPSWDRPWRLAGTSVSNRWALHGYADTYCSQLLCKLKLKCIYCHEFQTKIYFHCVQYTEHHHVILIMELPYNTYIANQIKNMSYVHIIYIC